MKTKNCILALSAVTILGLLFCFVQKPMVSELVSSNVEALAFDEWGGGNEYMGSLVQYEYSVLSYEWRTCQMGINGPKYDCYCSIRTCHDYGDFNCGGMMDCHSDIVNSR